MLLFLDLRSVASLPVARTELRWWGYQPIVKSIMYASITLLEHPLTLKHEDK